MRKKNLRSISVPKKVLVLTFLLVIVIPALLIGLTKTFGTLGGNKIYKSESRNWVGTNNYGGDFSNDDHWNQILPWILTSSDNACNFNIKQWNQDEFLGTPYAQVGSTMNFAPQVAATCIAPKESRSALVAYINILIIFFGMVMLMIFLGVKKWLARLIAFSASICGPVAVYLFWPHIVTLAWAPLVAYFTLSFFKYNSKKYFVGAVLSTACMLFSGQLEVVLLSLIFVLILLLMQFKLSDKKSQFKMYLKVGVGFVLSFMIAALSWIPTVIYAGTTPAGRERKTITTDVYLGGFSWLKHVISGFIDPLFYGTSTPYSTALTALPHARMTMWIPTIMTVSIVFYLLTSFYKLIVQTLKTKKIRQNISRLEAQIYFLSFCFFVLTMIYGKLRFAMYALNKIPFLGAIDENLYRFSGIFLLFVIFGMTATNFTNKTWKIVLSISAGLFAIQAAIFIIASSKVDNFGFVKDLRTTLPNLNVSNVYKIGFGISIILALICTLTVISKKDLLIYSLGTMLVISSVSIFVLKPQNFVDLDEKNSEKVLISAVKNGRLIAPYTAWSSIGTWYGFESVHGYSLPNNSNYAIDQTYQGCKFHAGFVFVPCDYLVENKTVYDLGNIQWAILKDNAESIDPQLKQYAKLDNGYTLYERPSGKSSLFALNGKCATYKDSDINSLDFIYLKSDHKYIESAGEYIFEKSKSDSKTLTSKYACILFSVAYHDEIKVHASRDIKAVDFEDYVAIDVKSNSLNKAQKWTVKFDNPNYLYSKIMGILGFIILAAIYFYKQKKPRFDKTS